MEDLQTVLDAIEQLRSEMNANFRAVRTQLNTVEYGVLTIAQKLLADAEVAELRAKMRKAG
jgi:hypothetical protein